MVGFQELMLFYDYEKFQREIVAEVESEIPKDIRKRVVQEIGRIEMSMSPRLIESLVLLEQWPLDFYMLYINPRTLKVSKSRVLSSVLTKAGYETFHWGTYGMISYSYTGVSGRCDLDSRGRKVGDIRQSIAWKYFECFKRFIDATPNDLVMVYKDRVYTGYFADFSFDENADNPLAIEYSFTFLVYPDRPELCIADPEIMRERRDLPPEVTLV